jgi:hypothetical protein
MNWKKVLRITAATVVPGGLVLLADIIHDFGDTEILLWYKHVEMTMF